MTSEPDTQQSPDQLAAARTRTRSRSRTGRPTSQALNRIYSRSYLDDRSLYHHEAAAGASDDEPDDEPDEQERESSDQAEEKEDEIVPEVRDGIPDERDLEKRDDAEKGQPALEKAQSSRSKKDPNLVTWDSPEDPANPKNWSSSRKWAATFVVSSFTFISPVSSSMVAPALQKVAADLKITQEVESQLVLSIFVLAYSIGPLILGPLSEEYGRVPVLQLSNLFFLAWNLGCGFAQTKGQMLAFRFLSGLGGSAPLAIGGGVLSDCFRPDERGKSIAIYSLAPLLGPAVGPIAGGFIAETVTWRWVFWSVCIADVLIQLSGLVFLQETYAPKILHNKAKKLRKETGNENLKTEFEHPELNLINKLKVSLVRPFRMLATQPIVQCLAIYMAYIYGIMYLVLSTFPTLWTTMYHENNGIGGLNYISLGIGFFFGTQISAPINDRIYRRLKKRNNNVGRPEFRVPLMFPGSLLVPIGLFWYGWSAQAHIHWIMPNIGAVIFASGTIVGFQCIQTYLVDAYTRYAASAVGAGAFLRSLAGFGFPLFAPYMYASLHYGWGNSLLAFIGIGLGIPAPFLLWNYGATLRAKSKFAAGGG
ncbi:putative MFS multidrug transporter [Viridothelium virens]|uniref:Putative MFS multidrug transporter n=1 Tax=Viridothelium virens TaxID=1048519 RepID=A0A6A6GT75_VIRVR|nr:putative MFS multidrug transporter [Viridothelium virens]